MRKFFRALATIGILAIFIVYFIFNIDNFRPLLDIKFWMLGLIALGDLALITSNGLLTKYILRPFNKDLPLRETTYIALITSVGNFFAPAGAGLAFRAVYLKKKHHVPYGDYIPILTGNYLIVFLVNSFFGLVALVMLRSRTSSHYRLLVVTFAGLMLFSLALAFIKIPSSVMTKLKNKSLVRIANLLQKVAQGWERITNDKKLLGQLAAITTSQLFLTVGITWLIIHSLHLSAELGALLLFAVISSLSLFLNITPANLGIKEALYIFWGGVLGFSATQIISIALIDRGVMFIIMLVSYLVLRSSETYRLKTDS